MLKLNLSRFIASPVMMTLLSCMPLACTHNEAKTEEPVAAGAQAGGTEGHEFTVDANGKVEFNAEIVYFKFDDATLTPEGSARLDALAAFLKKSDAKVLQVEGHSDERGSTEYNLALGERRAKSVRDYLTNIGVDPTRVGTISYGAEKPAVDEHTEVAYAQNRRAEFTLTSR